MAAVPVPRGGRAFSGRAFWALGLAAVAVAGLYSSARAASEDVAAVTPAARGCVIGEVEWGYDMELVPGAGYAIAGIHIDTVPDECAGEPIVLFYQGVDGSAHSSPGILAAGLVDVLDPALLATMAGPSMTAGWTLGR